MTYTIVVMLNSTTAFMSKEREERDRIVDQEIRPLLAHFSKKFKIDMYDCDFTNPHVSDFLIAQTESLEDFGYFMGYMRESKVLAAPYFEIKDLVIGVPQNFRGSMNIKDIIATYHK